MDIAFVAPVVYPFIKGGVEKRMHEVGKRLVERGHDITIFSRHWWDGPAHQTHEGMDIRAIGPASNLYVDGDRRSISSSIGLAARLVKPLAKGNYDLVVTPVAPYFHIFTTRLMSSLRRTPLVITWHEVWGNYWYRYMGKEGVIGKIIESMTAYLPQHAVAPSKTTANRLQDLAPRRKVTVIPNGINFGQIASTAPASDGYDVLFAGRLIQDKNVAMLIDAFAEYDTDAELGIIGEGPEADRLRQKAQQSDAADRIDFLGFLDEYDDVIAHMRAAEIFVSPSTREGFGITLLEAMAADCIVITVEHKYSAGSEVVNDAGFVVEPTVTGISNALKQALDGKRPVKNPMDKASGYDWDAVADQTEIYYDSII